jgi:beta-N-acetylhexosaminidase
MRHRPFQALAAVALLAALAVSCSSAAPGARPSQRPTSASPATTAPPSPTASPNPAGLSDEQLVGQLFVTYLYGSGPDTVTPSQRAANLALYGEPTPAEVVRHWHLGGVILLDHNTLDPARANLSTGNLQSAAQLSGLTAGLQAVARADTGVPLLIGTDQEGGLVQRIPFVPQRPSEQQQASLPPSALQQQYAGLGRALLGLGVNLDYAPVADVSSGPGSFIGSRSFGTNPQAVAGDVVAAVAGLQSAGVLATLKHWPGHGATSVNSHEALPVIDRTRAQWAAIDRVPFAAAAGQVASIMVGYLAFPQIDPSGVAAPFSRVLVQHELRDVLGYQGLVVTDSLWMEPARAMGTPVAAARSAIDAGDDQLLMSPDLPSAYAALLQSVRTDAAFKAEVVEAVRRILAAKHRLTAGSG